MFPFHVGDILVKKLDCILPGWGGILECLFLLPWLGSLFSFMDYLRWIPAK